MSTVLPAGELTTKTLRAMAEAPDLAAAGQVLALRRHPLSEPFRKAVAAYASDHDLLAFEVTLDRAFYAGWTADARRLRAPDGFRTYIAAEVEKTTNLRTALKLRGRKTDPSRYLVEGGRWIGPSTFVEITQQPVGTPPPGVARSVR